LSNVCFKEINAVDTGVLAYEDALKLQLELHKSVALGKSPGTILFVEHPEVITVGRNAGLEDFKETPAQLEQSGVNVVRIERGGQLTAHMPGQLVVYPILPIKKFSTGAKDFVHFIEKWVMAALNDFDIDGYVDEQYPGVWVGRRKICAVGVRIKDRVSMHGFALNVNNELSLFDKIVPCGIKDRGITSMCDVLGTEVDLGSVKSSLLELLKVRFGVDCLTIPARDDLQS
jgi:lipoyl(octanoyl) transferase